LAKDVVEFEQHLGYAHLVQSKRVSEWFLFGPKGIETLPVTQDCGLFDPGQHATPRLSFGSVGEGSLA
jgi:hypothetical protein